MQIRVGAFVSELGRHLSLVYLLIEVEEHCNSAPQMTIDRKCLSDGMMQGVSSKLAGKGVCEIL